MEESGHRGQSCGEQGDGTLPTITTPSSTNTGVDLLELDCGIYLTYNAKLFYIGCTGLTCLNTFSDKYYLVSDIGEGYDQA